jgi:hypothetical protein
MEINQELTKLGLKQITNFQYNVGDCLFDAIVYLLKYLIISNSIRMNFMFHFQECLRFEIPKALLCHKCELNYEFLHDLHHGQANNEKTYIKKNAIINFECWVMR